MTCPLCHAPAMDCRCGSTPAQTAPLTTRFVKRGAYMVCDRCNLDAHYCRCAMPAADPAQATAESTLRQRIRDHKDSR